MHIDVPITSYKIYYKNMKLSLATLWYIVYYYTCVDSWECTTNECQFITLQGVSETFSSKLQRMFLFAQVCLFCYWYLLVNKNK